jgi:hypothetical protein
MLTRTCTECGRVFEPSSGHKQCPSCRSRDLCACGASKQKKSLTCWDCKRSEAGPSNSNWKGGRAWHKRGYVMICAPDHPRAVSKGRYVFEHIIVMEKMLGRYLGPEETVHHLNGIRDDNRPGNLELWTKPQPTGIRASDALARAREVIAQYGDPPSRLPEGRLAWACETVARIEDDGSISNITQAFG